MPIYQRAEDPEIEDIQDEDVAAQNDPNLEPIEKSWAKRYGDLRRHTATKDARIKQLEEQLANASQNNLQLPSADDDKAVDEWIGKYPQIGKIVTDLARRVARKETENLDARVKQLSDQEHELKKERAQTELSKLHPDFFDTILPSPDFTAWLDTKSQRIQDAMYDNDYDYKAAADVITLYKSETGYGKQKKSQQQDKRQAATFAPKGQQTVPSVQKGYTFSESQIAAMDRREFEANEEAIEQAHREGKILMDMTGGAR